MAWRVVSATVNSPPHLSGTDMLWVSAALRNEQSITPHSPHSLMALMCAYVHDPCDVCVHTRSIRHDIALLLRLLLACGVFVAVSLCSPCYAHVFVLV